VTVEPLVSVLTPSYNQARWLPDNLRSVSRQTYPNLEHVVMDGGSDDGSVEILQSADPPVLWHSGPDGGQSDAINHAFARSSGEIIGWLNSDDAYFRADTVTAAVDAFSRHPDVGLLYGHAALVNGGGELLYVLWTPPLARSLVRFYNVIYQPTIFIRRSAIGRSVLVDPAYDYMMDRELWIHLSRVTRFHRLNRVVAIDRHHPNRKSYKLLEVARRDFGRIREQHQLPALAANRLWTRAAKVALRAAGLSKIGEARKGSDILTLAVPSARVVAMRQVAQLRRWMPTGDS